MNILITGGSGFIGANLIKKFLNESDFNILTTVNRGRVPFEDKRLKVIKLDITDFGKLLDLFEKNKVDVVIHSAAVVSFRKKHRDLMYKVNVEATRNIVNIMLEKNIERIIYVSSVAALSKNEKKLITEEDIFEENDNSSYYGKTKYLGELEVWRGQEEGLKVTVINPSVVLGPAISGWKRSSAGIFYRVYKGLPFFPPGSTGWVSVSDVVNVLFKSVMEPENSVGKKWIVSAENKSWKDVLSQICDGLKIKKPNKTIPKSFMKFYANIANILPEKILPISYEEAISSSLELKYDNSKIKKEFYSEFEDINSVIRLSTNRFLEDLKNGNLN